MVTVPNSCDCLQVAYWKLLVIQTVLVLLELFAFARHLTKFMKFE